MSAGPLVIAANDDCACIPFVPRPVDVTDEARFPEMALARREFASLSAERRARHEREWEQ